MFSSFRYSIAQAKIDGVIGEKLLDDTEKFFKNNRALRRMINENNSSLHNSRKTSRKHEKSYIY